MPKQHAQKRRGFTLTELAIVLGVMGTILSAIWVASARVNASKNAQKANEQVQMILAGYKSLYASKQIDVTVLTDMTCLGVNAGFFPADMLPSVSCVTDAGALGFIPIAAGEPTYPQTPWGGTSYVQVMLSPLDYFSIRVNNLTQEACISIANASMASGSMVAYNVSGTNGFLPPLGTASLLTTSGISAACSLASGSNYLDLGFPVH